MEQTGHFQGLNHIDKGIEAFLIIYLDFDIFLCYGLFSKMFLFFSPQNTGTFAAHAGISFPIKAAFMH